MFESIPRPLLFLAVSLALSFPALWYGCTEGFPRTFGMGSSAACPEGNRWLTWNAFIVLLHLASTVYVIVQLHNSSLSNPLKTVGLDLDDEESLASSTQSNKLPTVAEYQGPIGDEELAGPNIAVTVTGNGSGELSGKTDLWTKLKDYYKRTGYGGILYAIVAALWFVWQVRGLARASQLGSYQGACENVQHWIYMTLSASLLYVIFLAFVVFKMLL